MLTTYNGFTNIHQYQLGIRRLEISVSESRQRYEKMSKSCCLIKNIDNNRLRLFMASRKIVILKNSHC